MRVVYAGPLDRGGTCYARLRAFERLVDDIGPFDTEHFIGSISPYERVFGFGQGLRRVNEEFKKLVQSVNPELVWLDKPAWVRPPLFELLREERIPIVQHNTDTLLPLNWKYRLSHRTQRKPLSFCDMYFATNRPDYERLFKDVLPVTLFTHLGYDNSRFDSTPIQEELRKQWENDLLFVGHYERRTEEYVLALSEAGLPVRVFGSGWNRSKHREKLTDYVKFARLDDNEYLLALKSTKICLCFVSEWNHNEISGRSFEIPACGAFLLAMRTRQHCECFVEGAKAEFFDSPEELVRKARCYLSHPNERARIARAGNKRCVESGYSWAKIMERDWERVRSLLSGISPEFSKSCAVNA